MRHAGSLLGSLPRRAGQARALLTPGTLIAATLLLATAVRLLGFFPTLDDPYLQFRQGDEEYYHRWATDIAGGAWARGSAFHTSPLYAYVLALAYRAGGQAIAVVRALNVLMGLGAACLVALTARRLLGPRRAVAATAAFALCTAPVFYEWLPEKTALALLLAALSFHQITRAGEPGAPLLRWLPAGFAVALAALAHPTLLVLAPSVWLALACGPAARGAAALRPLGAFTLGVALGILPATVHNYASRGDFVLISYNLGTTFYLGNHAGNTTGTYASAPFSSPHEESEEGDFNREAERRAGRELQPSAVSRYWLGQGLAEIRANPGLSLRRFWRRLRWTLGAEEATDTRTFVFYAERHRILGPPLWGFGAVSLLGLIGLLLSGRERRFRVFAFFILFFAASLSAVLTYGRYRLPLLVPLSLLAGEALGALPALVRRRRWRAAVALGIAAGGIGWFVFGTVLPEFPLSYFPDFNNQGNRYLERGRFDLAVAEYEKALTERPGYAAGVPRLYGWLARQYTARGQPGRARELLHRMIARYQGDAGAQERLAREYREAIQGPRAP